MVNRLQVWFFLLLATTLLSVALLPMVRAGLGIDSEIGVPFSTAVMCSIAGLMSGLAAMILMVRRQITFSAAHYQAAKISPKKEKITLLKIQASGLLIFTGIPLANFIIAFWVWVKNRHLSEKIDIQGREMLNFQISIYLYILLCLFMVFAVIGIIITPAFLVFHLICTLLAIVYTASGKHFKFPLNIKLS